MYELLNIFEVQHSLYLDFLAAAADIPQPDIPSQPRSSTAVRGRLGAV